MRKHAPLLVGFNWGSGSCNQFDPQSRIEPLKFSGQDIGSLARAKGYLAKYLGQDNIELISQTNYCFFRSYEESKICQSDVDLCKPIFDSLINILEPSYLICLSSTLRDYW